MPAGFRLSKHVTDVLFLTVFMFDDGHDVYNKVLFTALYFSQVLYNRKVVLPVVICLTKFTA